MRRWSQSSSFHEVEKLKKTFLSRRKVFFFSRCELDKRCCLLWSKQAKDILSDLISRCQCNRRMMSSEPENDVNLTYVMSVYKYSNFIRCKWNFFIFTFLDDATFRDSSIDSELMFKSRFKSWFEWLFERFSLFDSSTSSSKSSSSFSSFINKSFTSIR
jgi:hypothetical protein